MYKWNQSFNVQTWNGSQWVTQRSYTASTYGRVLIRFDNPVTTNKIRVNITQTTNNDGSGIYQCQLSEVYAYEFLPRGYNFASNTTANVSADSTYSYWGSYPASNAIDGNYGTYWINNRQVPGWVQVDFTDKENIQYVYLYGVSQSRDFTVQTWDGSSWVTQATLTGNLSDQQIVKFSNKVLTSKIRVNITDSVASDGTGNGNQCQLTEIEARETPKDSASSTYRQVTWEPNAPTGRVNGRTYGLFKLTDIDRDDIKEGLLVADLTNRHVAVINNDAHGSELLWDRYIEYPDEHILVVTGYDGIKDIDGDGRTEIVYCSYDDRISDPNQRWTLYIVDALENYNKQTISKVYLRGIEDLDNDGKMEILVSEETTRTPLNASTIKIYKFQNGSYQSVWSKTDSSFVIRTQPCSGLPSNISDGAQRQGQEIVNCDIDNNGIKEFFINDNGTCKGIDFTTGSTRWSTTTGTPFNVVSMLNNQNKQIIACDNNGTMRLIDNNGAILATRNAGGLTTITPVTGDIDGDGNMEMIVADSIKTRVYRLSGSGATFLFENTGKGTCNQSSQINSAVLADMNGDGKQEIILRDVDLSGNPVIKVVKGDNTTLWSYTFTGFGSNDIYEWMAGDYNGDGIKDVYVALNQGDPNAGRSRIINGANQTILWSIDEFEFDPVNYPGMMRGFAPAINLGASADMDGDGQDELVLVALDYLLRCDWNGSAMTYTKYYSPYDIYYNMPILADVNNDGNWEYIMANGFWDLAVLNNTYGRIWQYDTPRFDLMRRCQGSADVNNDGIVEIAAQYMDGTNANCLVCYNGSSGNVLWSINLKNDVPGSGDIVVKDIQASDIDGDGLKEYILTTNTGYLYAVNGEANPQNRVCWKINLGTELGSPIITDIDRDNKSEVLVIGGDGKIHAVK